MASKAPSATAAGSLPPGTLLKHWTLGKPLGKGAFGFVYDAHAAGDPAARVALKVVTLVGQGASKLKKSSQSREAALLFKEYNLYSGACIWPLFPPFAFLLHRAAASCYGARAINRPVCCGFYCHACSALQEPHVPTPDFPA